MFSGASLNDILYWTFMYGALVVVTIYYMITAKYYQIVWWKLLIITLVANAFTWGMCYLTAWVEAGFQPPPSVNGVRVWVYCPLYFLLCAYIFKIEPRRMCDTMTMFYPLGFAVGKIGCVFAGCCYGFPYEGFGAIYNPVLHYNTFPVQIIEAVLAFGLFFGYLVYLIRVNFKITGRQYPVMLIFYSFRFVLEFLRDDTKLGFGISSLAIHALVGGVVGAIWLFFTYPQGYVVGAKIMNFFRKLFKKEVRPVLTKEEYRAIIKERERLSVPPAKLKEYPVV